MLGVEGSDQHSVSADQRRHKLEVRFGKKKFEKSNNKHLILIFGNAETVEWFDEEGLTSL